MTPAAYVEVGGFSTNTGARVGYDIGREVDTGALLIGEVGTKTDFATTRYPGRYSLTGFATTGVHSVLNRAAVEIPDQDAKQRGSSGIVIQGQQVVWRADHGLVQTGAPTAIALYASAGIGLDSSQPIRSDVFGGATLQAPFRNRPADRFGLKLGWERLNPGYSAYLGAANAVAGGPGGSYPLDGYTFELNAHLQLPGGLAFEPVLQYGINLNSYYDPFTARRARDGVFAIGMLVIPVGVLLGLSVAS